MILYVWLSFCLDTGGFNYETRELREKEDESLTQVFVNFVNFVVNP